jgi:hypothetical protein
MNKATFDSATENINSDILFVVLHRRQEADAAVEAEDR